MGIESATYASLRERYYSELEKEMATHSSVLAWGILWMEGPGRLLSVGSHGVRHD